MRGIWAVIAGLALGIGAAWWFSREPGADLRAREKRAEAQEAKDARPSLYRWRDAAGVLQITDKPPQGRPYVRIEREPAPGISVSGGPAD
ncbi:MAG: DUF4124 domain-containing protein [Pseudoxanthomonas sp.]|nr:DUF4124 domain-containing protein [Pseudoxanthomonas sp.]